MKLFVWDFHGVLEEGNHKAVTDVTNSVLERFGYTARLTKEDCKKLYGRKWFEYFQYLLPEEGLERHLELQEACFAASPENEEAIKRHIRPNSYADEVLSAIRERGHYLLLISNTNDIGMFLRITGLEGYFHKAFSVHAHDPDNRRTKSDVLKEFLEGRSFDEIIIIGDSPGDISLADICGGTTYLYAHPGFEFRECSADYRIRDLREILKHL